MGFVIEPGCTVHKTAIINVKEGVLGAGSMVGANVLIEGALVEIGRESFIDVGAHIGGGSCFDSVAFLRTGHWFHMGRGAHINIARGITIGNEFGCGIDTKIFTHGAYLDSYNLGAPSQWAGINIGNNVWMPNAWVNPGVSIGDNVVISARSLVNKSLPSGVLAGGIPAKILKVDYLPKIMNPTEKRILIFQIIEQLKYRLPKSSGNYQIDYSENENSIKLTTAEYDAVFDLHNKIMNAPVTDLVFSLKDQLRRNGIRFPYSVQKGMWIKW